MECEGRAFAQSPVGIACAIEAEGAGFTLQVSAADAAQALAHLQQYEIETRNWPAPPSPSPARLSPNAWNQRPTD